MSDSSAPAPSPAAPQSADTAAPSSSAAVPNGGASSSSSSPPPKNAVGKVEQGAMSSSTFRFLLLVMMVLQNSSTVLVGRHTRAGVANVEDLYVVNHLIMVCEGMKFLLACVLEHFHTNGNLLRSVKENVLDRPVDALKIVIPSLLYLVQNSLLYVALSNLSAPLFQVTYQCKLLTTALVSVVMLNRRYSPKQWVCLFLLGVGVAVVVLGESDQQKRLKEAADAAETVEMKDAAAAAAPIAAEEEDGSLPAQSLFVGLLAVSVACLSSALAGVYFEKVLKKPTTETGTGKARAPVSLWMRNIQMAFFSVCIALVQFLNLDGDDGSKKFMHGFTGWVYCLVMLQAGGGLLVAAVIKYADNVLKGLATGVSVVVATLASMVLFGTPLSGQFVSGAVLILGSVFFFSNNLPGVKRKVESNVEMKGLLPK